MAKKEGPCETCGRGPGERRPRCLRCADTPRGRMLPGAVPGWYLVVDPGRRTGSAIAAAWKYPGAPMSFRECGEGDTWTRYPEQVVTRARAEGCEALVIETSGVGMDPIRAYGLGTAAGPWLWLWRTSAPQGGRSVVVEVYPATWRSTVLGGPQRSTEEWKAAAKAHVVNRHRLPGGPEMAEAVCLAEHALCSLDLADAVGPRRLAQLGWREPRGCWVEGRFVEAEGGRR